MRNSTKKLNLNYLTLSCILLFFHSISIISQSNASGIEETEIKSNTNLEETNVKLEKGSSQKESVDSGTETKVNSKENTVEEIDFVEKVQKNRIINKKVANVAQSVVTNFFYYTLWKLGIENEELDIINLVDILAITVAVLILFILVFYLYFKQKIKKLAQTRKGVEVIAFTLKSQEERINALEQMIGE